MFIPLFSGSMVQLKITATNKMETVIQKVLQIRDDTVPPVEPQYPGTCEACVASSNWGKSCSLKC